MLVQIKEIPEKKEVLPPIPPPKQDKPQSAFSGKGVATFAAPSKK